MLMKRLICFISHYVQIKLLHETQKRGSPSKLYIPLRSDKTHESIMFRLFFMNFISHYVQIKPLRALTANLNYCSFISHYVQIKRITSYADIIFTNTLYPTTFR